MTDASTHSLLPVARPAWRTAWGFLALCLLVLSFVTVYFLGQRLVAQLYCRTGQDDMSAGGFQSAFELFDKALGHCSGSAVIQKLDGWGYERAAEKESSVVRAWRLSLEAREHFRKSFFMNPLDAETAYGAALTEANLEELFPKMYPRRKYNPFDATPFFQNAVRLFPNAPAYQLAFARFLGRRDMPDMLQSVVLSLATIYPDGCDSLLREPFMTPLLNAYVQSGLKRAITENINPRIARQRLSDMLLSEGDIPGAIHQYLKALEVPTAPDTAVEYLHLGGLYLQNGQQTEAETCFFKGIGLSQNRDQEVIELLRRYRQEGSEAMLDFFSRVKAKYALSTKTGLALIQNLIELKQLNRAQDMLAPLNLRSPTAEGFYLLSRIAEIRQDWNGMEDAIRKAIAVEPGNMQYRQVLVGLLMRMGKYDMAEQELDSVIAGSRQPSQQLYSERAQLRLNRKDYTAAVSDWEEALRVGPIQASLYAQIAEAYIQLGNLKQAISFYQKALALDPKNVQWQQRIRDLTL
jgi:tetratricopeptide (TPR) repeat protein